MPLFVSRAAQWLMILSSAGVGWLGMMIVHETGHVAVGWATGARLARVVLHPLVFSRTDFALNPHPLATAWGGAILGSILPVVAWALAQACRRGWWYLWRYFAGFCLIANGVYLGTGVLDPVGDAQDILRCGGARWQLLLFGLAAIGAGFTLWNRLGPCFGLGASRGRVDGRAAVAMLVLLLAIVLIEVAIDARIAH